MKVFFSVLKTYKPAGLKIKLLICSFFLTTALFSVSGQAPTDSITIKKSFGTVFLQHGKILTPKQLLKITKTVDEAYNEMKLAKNNFDAGSVIGFTGGAFIGWPIGTAIGGGEPNWTLAAVGAGLIVVSVPFTSAYKKHTIKAISIFNSRLKNTGLTNIDFKIGCTTHGVGLSLSF